MRKSTVSGKPGAKTIPAGVPVGGTGGVEWVLREASWHRAQSRRLLFATLILAAALAVSLLVNGGLLLDRPTPVYFMSSPNGRLVPLTPLNHPVMTRTALLDWAGRVVAQTLSIDFANYRQELLAVRGNYTEAAYNQVIDALMKSGNLKMILANRLSVSASVTQAPILAAHGFIGKVDAWKVQFPVTVSYESSSGVGNTQNLLATVLIERVPQTRHPRGIAIAQLVLAQRQ
ncbi:MAG: DotI/IcmL family type IV secretion protein [Acidiferrobacterales bacterium]